MAEREREVSSATSMAEGGARIVRHRDMEHLARGQAGGHTALVRPGASAICLVREGLAALLQGVLEQGAGGVVRRNGTVFKDRLVGAIALKGGRDAVARRGSKRPPDGVRVVTEPVGLVDLRIAIPGVDVDDVTVGAHRPASLG